MMPATAGAVAPTTTEMIIVLGFAVALFWAYCYLWGPWGTAPLAQKLRGKERTRRIRRLEIVSSERLKEAATEIRPALDLLGRAISHKVWEKAYLGLAKGLGKLADRASYRAYRPRV